MNKQEKQKWYKKEFEKIHHEIKKKDTISYLDFLRIRNFKLQNHTIENEYHIQEVVKISFQLAQEDKIKEAIQNLLELNGVAIPIASTILAMKYPEKFAIIDRKVITQLGKKEWIKDYLTNPDTYEKYLILLKEKAKEANIKLRDYERHLFEK